LQPTHKGLAPISKTTNSYPFSNNAHTDAHSISRPTKIIKTSYKDVYGQTMLYIIFHLCDPIYLPVHIMSISGASLDPNVLRYSEFWTLGVARAAQYCVGHNIKRGWPRCWNTSLLTDTCNHISNNFSFMKLRTGLNKFQWCLIFSGV
jgi:hypothetical protein